MKFLRRKTFIWILSAISGLAVAFNTPSFTQLHSFAAEKVQETYEDPSDTYYAGNYAGKLPENPEDSDTGLEALEKRYGSLILTYKLDFMNCKLIWRCPGSEGDEGGKTAIKEFRIYRSSDKDPTKKLVRTVDGNSRSAVAAMGGPRPPKDDEEADGPELLPEDKDIAAEGAASGDDSEKAPPTARCYTFTVVPVFAEYSEQEALRCAASVRIKPEAVAKNNTDYFNGSSEDYSVSREESHSIFVFSDRHEESEKLMTLLRRADRYIQDKFGTDIEFAIDDGDNVNGKHEYALANVTGEIKGVLGDNVRCTYIYGSHDENVRTDAENYFLKGPREYPYFYVYGIDYDEMADPARGAAAARVFSQWAAGVTGNCKGKPVIVVSHMPMHERRFDNMAAHAWLDALNAAGENLDIVVLWGHNHTGQSETDGRNFYVAKGSYMLAEGMERGIPINFTYMNAGYIKYGMASVITIQGNKLYISRLGLDGNKGYHVAALEHEHDQ